MWFRMYRLQESEGKICERKKRLENFFSKQISLALNEKVTVKVYCQLTRDLLVVENPCAREDN